jgi:hypothetical protein
MTSDEPAQSQDTTRDWAAEEREALRIEQERQAELLRKQRERE